MAVPTTRQVARRNRINNSYKHKNKIKVEEEPISEAEHQKRVKMLKEIGLIK